MHGGCAGGVYTAANLPLDAEKVYTVKVGKGGAGVVGNFVTDLYAGADGGASSFDGFFVPGGRGGQRKDYLTEGKVTMEPAQVCAYTAALGTAGQGGRGADSLLGTGGANVSEGGDGTLVAVQGYGAGGGACGIIRQKSGDGGDGIVIVYGYAV